VAVGSSHEECEAVVLTSLDGHSWTRLPPDPVAFGDDPGCGLFSPGTTRVRDITTGGARSRGRRLSSGTGDRVDLSRRSGLDPCPG
jgi:hypothetical protein